MQPKRGSKMSNLEFIGKISLFYPEDPFRNALPSEVNPFIVLPIGGYKSCSFINENILSVIRSDDTIIHIDTMSASVVNFDGKVESISNTVVIDGTTLDVKFQNCDLIIDKVHRINLGSSPISRISTQPKHRLVAVVYANKVVRVFHVISTSQVVLKWKFQDPIEKPCWIGAEFGGYTGEYLLLFTSSSKNHTNIYLTEATTGRLIRILTCAHGPCVGISVHRVCNLVVASHTASVFLSDAIWSHLQVGSL